MDVALVRWPEQEPRRQQLHKAGLPRILLVDASAPPPRAVDDLEDWVRLPVDDADLDARIDWLVRRAGAHRRVLLEVDDGLLRMGDRFVSLAPVEARLMRALVDRFGAVVGRDQLARAGWPDGSPGRNALDVQVLRLRRRIAGLGLQITTVRSRGYLLGHVTDHRNAPSGRDVDRSDNGQEAEMSAQHVRSDTGHEPVNDA